MGGRTATVHARCKLWVYLGIIATIRDPPGKDKKYPEDSGIYWQPQKSPGRQVLCLQVSFSRVLWAIWMGASWDGATVFDH